MSRFLESAALLDHQRAADLRATDAQLSASAQLYGVAQPRSASGYGDYGMRCTVCGGTPSGDSPRGFVGRCSCGGSL